MSIRILLVDDHRMMREALRTMLERERDIEVVGEAGDGRTALKLARELPLDVVIMDIGMPDLNGIDTTARLLARRPELKIIGLSAYLDRRFVIEMFQAGAHAYVTKLSAGTELTRAIRAVMANRSYVCPEVADAVIGNLHAPQKGDNSALACLGRREREVLQLLAEGKRSHEIAAALNIAVSTVEVHRRNIMRKLQLHSIADLTRFAIREGLTAA